MRLPTYRTPSEGELESYSPQSTFGQFLDSALRDAFWDSSTGQGIFGYKSLAEQRQEREAAFDEDGAITSVDLLPTNLQPLSEEDWANSQYHRKGMKYEKGVNNARMKIYAEEHDASKLRERTIARRNAGFWEGLSGFAVGIIGSLPAVENFVPIPGLRGATLTLEAAEAAGRAATKGIGAQILRGATKEAAEAAAKKTTEEALKKTTVSLTREAAAGAAENVIGESVVQLVTARQREAAGIQLTSEELMLNFMFATVVGAGMPVVSAGFKKGKMKYAEYKQKQNGEASVTVNDGPVTVQNVTDNAVKNSTVDQRTRVVTTLQDSYESAGRDPQGFQQTDPSVEAGESTAPDLQERAQAKIFEGDEQGAKDFLTTSRLPQDQKVIDAMSKGTTDEPVYKAKTLDEQVDEIDQLTAEEKEFVSDADDQDISNIKVAEGQEATEGFLAGETINEVADATTENVGKGLTKAIEVVQNLNCS